MYPTCSLSSHSSEGDTEAVCLFMNIFGNVHILFTCTTNSKFQKGIPKIAKSIDKAQEIPLQCDIHIKLMFARIVKSNIFGPYFSMIMLTGQRYFQFLKQYWVPTVVALVHNVNSCKPLDKNLCYQQDGAPPDHTLDFQWLS